MKMLPLPSAAPAAFTRSVRHMLALLVLLCCAGIALAQKPVHVIVSLTPPYSNQISSYYLGNTPKLRVMLSNTDLAKPSLQVRLKMTIKNGAGVVVQSNDYGNYPILHLDAGVPVTVTMSDLAPYFSINNLTLSGISREEYMKGFFKEGIYSFCFEAIEVASRQSVSKEECQNLVSLAYSEPPLLNSPIKGGSVAPREPINTVFQWTPRHMGSPNAAFNTEYVFQLIEMNDPAVSAQSAFERGRPLYEKVTDATSLFYGPAEPLLIPGKRYAWRVLVRQKTNAGDGQQFRNGGYSEVSYFDYVNGGVQGDCKPPTVSYVYNSGTKNLTQDYYERFCNCTQQMDIGQEGIIMIKLDVVPGVTECAIELDNQGLQPEPVAYSDPNHYFRLTYRGKNGTAIFRAGTVCGSRDNIAWGPWQTTAYGNTTISKPEPQIRGKVVWATSKDDDQPDNAVTSLLKSAIKNEVTTITKTSQTSALQYPVTADVNVYMHQLDEIANKKILLGTKKLSHADYSFGYPTWWQYNKFSVRTDAGAIFNANDSIYTFNLPRAVDTTLTPIVLTAKTVWFSPGVVCPECDPAKLSVDLLVDERIFDKMPYLKGAGYGFNGERVQMRTMFESAEAGGARFTNGQLSNGSGYCMVVASMKNGNTFKKLYSPAEWGHFHWMRVRYEGATDRYYPLPELYNTSKDAKQVTQWVSYPLKEMRQIYGKTTFKGGAGWECRVKLSIPGSSCVPADSRSVVEFEVMSDIYGKYVFRGIPEIKKDAPFKIAVVSRVADRNSPIEYDLTGNGSTSREFNIEFYLPFLTVTGRMLSPDGKPLLGMVYSETDGSVAGTSDQGFYSLKIYTSEPKKLKFVCNSFATQIIDFQPRKFNEGGTATYTEDDWLRLTEKLTTVADYKKTSGSVAITKSVLGFERPINASETLRGVADAGITRMVLARGTLSLTIDGERSLGGRLMLSRDDSAYVPYTPPATGVMTLGLIPGMYKARFEPVPGGEPFLPVPFSFELHHWQTSYMGVRIVQASLLTGKVTALSTRAAEKGVRVAVNGLPYETITDDNGKYSLNVPKNEDIILEVGKDGFDQVDTNVRISGKTGALDFSLTKRDPSAPNIKTISGFNVKITAIAPTSNANVFEVSGSIKLESNKVFTVKAGSGNTNVLRFKKALVTVGSDRSAAEPRADMKFEDAVMNVFAYGWAPVEASGTGGIRLRPGKKSDGSPDYSKGHIGAERLTLKLSNQNSPLGIPLRLPDADLLLDNINVAKLDSTDRFRYVFTTEPTGIVALSENTQFKLRFAGTGTDTSRRARYVEVPLGIISTIYVARDTAILNKDGINVQGYVKFPDIVGMKVGDSGRVRIDKFTIGDNFSIKELTCRVSETNALVVGVQKLQARITSFTIKSPGTSNVGLGLGGMILLKRDAAPAPGAAPKGNDTLFIKELSLTRTQQGNTVTADLRLGSKGIGVKGLNFTTPEGTSIKMSYNNAEKSFEFDGSGLISYKKESAGKAGAKQSAGNDSAASSMFPIEIQKFQLRSKDWSMLLVAKTNIKINLKVASIFVEKILVNVGSKVSMQEMNTLLVAGNGQTGNVAQDNNPDEPMDENLASWAIGVKGGFGFDLKGINTKIAGSFLVGNVNDKFEIVVNEIALDMETPAFTLAAKVAMAFNDSCAGFQAEAKLGVMQRELEAKFGYYKLYATASGQKPGMRLFAEVAVGGVIVTTGPITWFRIMGGFDFNTSSNQYMVKFGGDLGPTGTPKETMVVQNAFIEILFDVDKCGKLPVIKGGGELSMKNKPLARASLTLDFCEMYVQFNVMTIEPIPLPMAPGLMGQFQGSFFAKKATIKGAEVPMIFLYANIDVSSMGDVLKGQLTMAFGYNYDNAAKDIPYEIRNDFNKVDSRAKNGAELQGIAIIGSVGVDIGHSFSVSVGGLKVGSAGYTLKAAADAMLIVKLKDPATFEAGFNARLRVTAEVQVLSLKASGEAMIALGLSGGYADMREEAIRDKYEAEKKKGIDEFSINPYEIGRYGSKDRVDLARKKPAENGSMRAPNLYMKDYYEPWKREYDPQFSELTGATVGVQNDAMYTVASKGKYFSFTLNKAGKPAADDYKLTMMLLKSDGNTARDQKVYVNGTELGKPINRGDGNSTFWNHFEFAIPASALNSGDDVTVRVEGTSERPSYKVFRTTLEKGSEKLDWYIPHPSELKAYWSALENLQAKAISKDAEVRKNVLSKRALNSTNWEDYRTMYKLDKSPLTGNEVGMWVLGDDRTYATAYAGGWYSFKMKSGGVKDLVLRVRYWGSDINKAQTIYINNQKLARSTVNKEFPDQTFDVDYAIPNEMLADEMVIKYQADPNTASPTMVRTLLARDPAYFDKLMQEELAKMTPTASTDRSWYLKGYAECKVKIAMNDYPQCNDYCMFCSRPGFKLCLAASGNFSWRKPDGGKGDLKADFKFGNKTTD